jgi:hypothetical protein
MTEFFGLGYFGLGLGHFGSVFGHRLIMPRAILLKVLATHRRHPYLIIQHRLLYLPFSMDDTQQVWMGASSD